MNRRVLLNGLLLVVFLVVIGLIFFVQRDFTQRNFDFMPGMVSYVAYKPQADLPVRDVKRLVAPKVEGTVARGFMPLDYKSTPEDAQRAGRELVNPVADTNLAALERGAAVYARMCQPCHGPTGQGDGLVSQHGFPPPPSLYAENAMKMKDGQMFHIITYGQKNMPALASEVKREDRWNVIRHIRSLQQKSLASRKP
jgi:mono/diheme cytochrome c family protein